MDPLKSRQPLYSTQITCPRLICPHRTSTFRTSEKRTPLNSEQWTLMNPRHTLASTKLPPKTDSETTPTNNFVHIASGFCKIACHHRWPDSKTGHYIGTVAYCTSLFLHDTATERSKDVTSSCSTARAHITTPTGSIPNALNEYLYIFWIRSGRPFNKSAVTYKNNQVFILLLLL